MHTYSIRAAVTKTTGHYRRPGTMTTYCTGAPTDLHANTGKTRRICARCVKAEARDRAEAAAVVETHTPLTIATNAFEQGAYGPLDAPRPGRYTLRVCEDSAVLCKRGQCRTTSTRATGTLDEVRAAAAMFRHAWPADENGNPVEDEQAAADRAAASVDAYLDREYPALAAFLAADRAAAEEEARLAAALVTEAEATAGTWRGEWIGERTTAPTLFPLDREQGALFA
ncbi:hypothetical protein ACWEQC_00350 [Streptomyces shenzhenensis]